VISFLRHHSNPLPRSGLGKPKNTWLTNSYSSWNTVTEFSLSGKLRGSSFYWMIERKSCRRGLRSMAKASWALSGAAEERIFLSTILST